MRRLKIWLDFCEPKSITMLRPLHARLSRDHEVFITARDFDSTYQLLDEWGVSYIKVGTYGGGTLEGKLRAYNERLSAHTEVVIAQKPDFLFCITSPEALRVAFGLKIPNVMFNDEPRSYGCCALTLPYVGKVVVPQAIPLEWFIPYGISADKIVQFNGIDEVAWLNRNVFTPNPQHHQALGLQSGQYVVARPEPTGAVYLMEAMAPHETVLTQIIPAVREHASAQALKWLVITRNSEQYIHLSNVFASEIDDGVVVLRRGVAHLAHIMFHARLVVTGGGTMVRESALLGVPSVEFFPLDTYPQEQFLIDHGFPLVHARTPASAAAAVREMLGRPRVDTFDRIASLDDPLAIGLREFERMMG
jgi:predicted glycosyltransferase